MIIINRFMIEDLKLKGNDLIVYAEIVTNLNAAGEYQKTFKTTCKHVGLTQRSVERIFIKLQDMKLINVKKVKDNRPYVINIITVNKNQLEAITDKTFNDLISFFNAQINVREDLSSKNYVAYKTAMKHDGFSIDSVKDAIRCYRDTLLDQEYYKTHLYTFDKFMAKYIQYLPKGYEYEQYKIFYNNSRFNGDRSYHAGIHEEMFGLQEDQNLEWLKKIEV